MLSGVTPDQTATSHYAQHDNARVRGRFSYFIND